VQAGYTPGSSAWGSLPCRVRPGGVFTAPCRAAWLCRGRVRPLPLGGDATAGQGGGNGGRAANTLIGHYPPPCLLQCGPLLHYTTRYLGDLGDGSGSCDQYLGDGGLGAGTPANVQYAALRPRRRLPQT
jgi:hypothetical protein